MQNSPWAMARETLVPPQDDQQKKLLKAINSHVVKSVTELKKRRVGVC